MKRAQRYDGKRSKDASRPPKSRSIRAISVYLILLAGVLLIYGQTSYHGFINYDDPEYVTANIHVRSGLTLAGLRWALTSGDASNWFPITWISHMLDIQLFGIHSGPSHLVNVCLHAASTLMLFALFKHMTGSIGRSAFVAAVFAWHPLHVESVAWIAERKDVLCAFFTMLTLWAYVKYTERSSLSRYMLVVVAFCGGLMSKPMIVTFPLVALLLDIWPLRRLQKHRIAALLWEKLPLFALSTCASAIAISVQHSGGALVSLARIPLAERIDNGFLSCILYLRDFLWPTMLAVFYPYRERPLWQLVASGLAIVAVSAVAVKCLTKRPYITVGWSWYLITLMPVIGLIQIGSQSRADRYTYVPIIGIAIMVAWGLVELFERLGWSQTALAAVAICVCCLWGVLSWMNTQYWRNSITLFERALAVTDYNYIAYNNLGGALRQQGILDRAIDNFEHAVAIRPDDALAQDNLGDALASAGRTEQAMEHLQIAVRLNPSIAKSHVDLASLLLRSGNPVGAESQYRLAAQLDPADAAAQYGLGGALAMQGRDQDARAQLQAALPLLIFKIELNPEWVDGHYNLGNVYGLLGQTDQAIGEFSSVVSLRPDDAEARLNLGEALSSKGQMNEAQLQFAEALRLVPDYPAAHLGLARVAAALGKRDEAVREYREVLRLDPQSPHAIRELDALNRTR